MDVLLLAFDSEIILQKEECFAFSCSASSSPSTASCTIICEKSWNSADLQAVSNLVYGLAQSNSKIQVYMCVTKGH